MGRDKASLVHPDGRTLGRRAVDLLKEAGCDEVFLSLRSGQELPEGLDAPPAVLRDPAGESSGPISGILAAFHERPDADWLVVACDLPRLDLVTLTTLLAERRAGEIFLAYRSEFDGLPEPLCTFYGRDAKAVVAAAGTLCPRKILIRNESRLLEPATRDALANANTPEDWESAVKPDEAVPEWDAELRKIFISAGHDFVGRHGAGRLDHGITELREVECVAGMGLRGDRYFDYQSDYKGQVTFFDAAMVAQVREAFGRPELAESAFRRNLIVSGVDLREWVGKRFRFQGVEFEGSEECKPCYWMDEAVAPGAGEFLKGEFRGGLRARILSDGTLRAG
jgi:molybdopterin-guanine dinucleotide biosynthesis protein A